MQLLLRSPRCCHRGFQTYSLSLFLSLSLWPVLEREREREREGRENGDLDSNDAKDASASNLLQGLAKEEKTRRALPSTKDFSHTLLSLSLSLSLPLLGEEGHEKMKLLRGEKSLSPARKWLGKFRQDGTEWTSFSAAKQQKDT